MSARQRESACGDKKQFVNLNYALSILKQMQKENTRKDNHPLHVYHCKYCNNYHIGHSHYIPTNSKNKCILYINE